MDNTKAIKDPYTMQKLILSDFQKLLNWFENWYTGSHWPAN